MLQQAPDCKIIGSLSTGDLVQMMKMILDEYGLPKIVSDACTNFTLAIFKEFCGKINIQQIIKPATTTRAMAKWRHA